jgi:hypothetical protein
VHFSKKKKDKMALKNKQRPVNVLEKKEPQPILNSNIRTYITQNTKGIEPWQFITFTAVRAKPE